MEEEPHEVSFTSKSGPTFEASLYEPSFSEEKSESPREKLNEFLASRDISPIRHSLDKPWIEASERTKRHYTRKARQTVNACLNEIAPEDSEMLLSSLVKSKLEENTIDSSLMECLTECYNNATHWSTRRQILSIMADKLTFKDLQRWIPSLSRYRFNIARHHLLLHGRGSKVPSVKNTRMCIAPEKLDHFLAFITSTHIIQDIPFGEKTLKLSSNAEIKVPNVVRSLIPEHIVLQYLGYCKDVGFTPMSRSTLCKVLSVCSASTRKSLQGLDYVSAAGAKAFDELEKVVDKLGDDYGKGFTWAKVQKEKLQLAKRYLKGDYKVRVFHECISFSLTEEKYQSYLVTPKVDVTRGNFPFNQELRDFRKGGKWYGNIIGKCSKTRKLLNFQNAN